MNSIIRAMQFFEFVKGIADFSTEGTKVRLSPVLIHPMVANDVARIVGKIAMGLPLNCIVVVGGPDQFRLDELVREGLAAYKDWREVIVDPSSRYYRVELSERTLIPDDKAGLARHVSKPGSISSQIKYRKIRIYKCSNAILT